MRRELQTAEGSHQALARRYNLSAATVAKWRAREEVSDASHRPHRLQTTLSAAQEAAVVELRRTTQLPLDDLLAVVREFIQAGASRSGLNRCLRRHGVSRLAGLLPKEDAPKAAAKGFKADVPGFVH